MNIGDKLKELRKGEGISQEQLAEKIGVSRQAITKWETGKGIPDIENLVILADTFKLSLDELVSDGITSRQNDEKRQLAKYINETMYNVDCTKNIDINLISANKINIGTNTNENIYIKLESDTIEELESLLKIKIDDHGNRLDVDCVKKGSISKKQMNEELSITILLPVKYTNHCEIKADTENLYMAGLQLERIEYDGAAKKIEIKDCRGSIEFAGKSDYDINIDQIQGKLVITQLWASTLLNISEKVDFKVDTKKKPVNLYWKNNGEDCESFENDESENLLVVNGTKSEITINRI